MKHTTVVGITQGDTNGIGYETIIKALSDARMLESCTPVIYGSSRFFGIYKRDIPETEQLVTNVINSASDARPKRVNIINAVADNLGIEIGQPTVDGAKAAMQALSAGVADLKDGKIDALVTAPFNKHTMSQANFGYPGHTEYLTKEFGAKDSLMFLCNHTMRIGVATNHLPIAKVSSALSKDLIVSKLRLMNESLKRDFGLIRPKIAVLGLNPHGGDGGSIGTEEIEIIQPAVEAANAENILAFGPFSADGFFGTGIFSNYDAVLAMYHDQGLIPFKALAFDDGVNYTAGLPGIRTSPDHGTAFDIAGKNRANPGPMMAAIYCAIDIANNRRLYDEMTANPMEIKHFEGPKYEKTFAPE